jgi:hypothetical protein
MSDQSQDRPLTTEDVVSGATNGPAAQTATMQKPVESSRDRSDFATREGADFVPSPGETTMRAEPRAGAAAEATARQSESRGEPLMPGEQAADYHRRWEAIQAGFVDEPRQAVERADQLVAEVIKRIAEVFAQERGQLEGQWSRGDRVDTEALRLALRRYRSFFERLLSA